MTKALIPNRLLTGEMLDADRINENLAALRDDIGRNLAQRYTYSTAVFELDSLIDSQGSAVKKIPIRRPTGATSTTFEIVGVEFMIMSTGNTWTLSCSDATFESIALTGVGATTEVTDSRLCHIPIASTTTDVVFTITPTTTGGTYTVSRGWVVLHIRADRLGGSGVEGYSPNFLLSGTSTAGTTLDNELTAAAANVALDGSLDEDWRVEAFTARNFTGTRTWRLPSGARRLGGAWCYIVGGTGPADTAEFAVSGTGLTFTTTSVAATGTSNIVAAEPTTTSGTMSDAPTTSASDATVTLTVTVGTVESAILILFWS